MFLIFLSPFLCYNITMKKTLQEMHHTQYLHELECTAYLLVDIAAEQGVYYAIALIHDIGYNREQVEQLLKFLENTPGARKV